MRESVGEEKMMTEIEKERLHDCKVCFYCVNINRKCILDMVYMLLIPGLSFLGFSWN